MRFRAADDSTSGRPAGSDQPPPGIGRTPQFIKASRRAWR